MSDIKAGQGRPQPLIYEEIPRGAYWQAMAERLAQAATSEKSLPESVKDESRKASTRNFV